MSCHVPYVWSIDQEANCLLHHKGIDCDHRESWNFLLEVMHHQGEDKMSDKEYKRSCFEPGQLHPKRGGCKFKPQVNGSGYVHHQNV